MKKRYILSAMLVVLSVALSIPSTISAKAQATPDDGSVLPFPPPKSESVAKQRLQDSTMK